MIVNKLSRRFEVIMIKKIIRRKGNIYDCFCGVIVGVGEVEVEVKVSEGENRKFLWVWRLKK